MAIPVHLQQFKAAGIYRVVYDKSTVLTEDSQILRLVVGYSEQGPFNTPVYVRNPQDFVSLFGGISKKLEKRGIFFHRLALQMLQTAPILALNLKKFDGETVQGATISTEFSPKYEIIDTVEIKLEDIYDTTRFWQLSDTNLNNLYTVDGVNMDQYINLCVTNTKNVSFFIRKATGAKVSGYNITVNDWYSNDEMPDYMEKYKNNLISDFFAEIYVFNGKFNAKQVLTSSTLKNYFVVTPNEDNDNEKILKLRDKVIDAFGEPQDTLDTLYFDETSNAIGRWIGCLIPRFTDKQGQYQALDILFNIDSDLHGMMMSFNVDLLEETNEISIDLSGRTQLADDGEVLDTIYEGSYTSSVLGNQDSPLIADELNFTTNAYTPGTELDGGYEFGKALIDFSYNGKNRINGTLYITDITDEQITLQQVGADETITINFLNANGKEVARDEFNVKFDVTVDEEGNEVLGDPIEGGCYYTKDNAFMSEANPLEGPTTLITSISRLENNDGEGGEVEEGVYYDKEGNLKVSSTTVQVLSSAKYLNAGVSETGTVYDPSISFISTYNNNWKYKDTFVIDSGITYQALYNDSAEYDTSLINVLRKGDMLLASDGLIDTNDDHVIDESDMDGFFDIVFVQEMGTIYYSSSDEEVINEEKSVGDFKAYYIIVSGEPCIYDNNGKNYYVRLDNSLNQEIGTMVPTYLKGYTYKNSKPLGIGMRPKLEWQKFILSTLTDYKGLRTGLLNKAEIDYRYVIDTFESFPDSSLKSVFTYLCKEKQSAFAIVNFPSVQTFVKCPYASFTDANGIFNVNYIVQGCNKKKSSLLNFSLPSDYEGASFGAYYSPLKFSDGYLDTIVPSAGLVSNLFIEKYSSRQPYYIVAGPNYGSINAAGLVGPDYKYSMDELQIIEPYGVNIMVYRPSFGTFINANQTAKQTPKSALSAVNVRELVIYLQDEIEKVLQQYQWEFNNARTRNAILDRANQICSLIASNGGIQAYLNVMDESNNTPEIIDNEMAVLSTHIEPGRGCGKMVHELTLYRTGQMSAQSIES